MEDRGNVSPAAEPPSDDSNPARVGARPRAVQSESEVAGLAGRVRALVSCIHQVLRRSGSLAIASVVVLAACGGGSSSVEDVSADSSGSLSGSSSSGTSDKPGLFLQTKSERVPIIGISGSGAVVGFEVNPATGRARGFIMTAPDGSQATMAVDESSGLLSYWLYQNTITLFENYRTNEGLVDVAVIDAAGSRTIYRDLSYRSAHTGAAGTDVDSRATKESDLPGLLSAFSAATTASACVVSAAFVFGEIALPPAAFFLAGSQGTLAVTCIAGAAGVWTLRPNASTVAFDALSRDTLLKNVATADNVSLAASTTSGVINAQRCILEAFANNVPGTVASCISAAVDFLGLAGNSTMKRLSASVDMARDVIRRAEAARGVYCCDGPDQLRQHERATWKAYALASELPASTAMRFSPTGVWSLGVTEDGAFSERHTYDEPGDYTMMATADLGGDIGWRNSPSREVRVYGELEVSCCTVTGTTLADGSFQAGTDVRIGMNVSGGRLPYVYEMSHGFGTTAMETGIQIAGMHFTYPQPGTYDISLKVTDADGTVKTSPVRRITVADAGPAAGGTGGTSWDGSYYGTYDYSCASGYTSGGWIRLTISGQMVTGSGSQGVYEGGILNDTLSMKPAKSPDGCYFLGQPERQEVWSWSGTVFCTWPQEGGCSGTWSMREGN
ncbi:MAG: PKD domain-containing protein [Burkholderiaceae bacterium]